MSARWSRQLTLTTKGLTLQQLREFVDETQRVPGEKTVHVSQYADRPGETTEITLTVDMGNAP